MRLFNPPLVRRRIADSAVDDETINRGLEVITKWANSLKNEQGVGATREVSIQGQFLLRIFEDCLGFSTQSAGLPSYNLMPEVAIGADSADGGLGFYGKGQSRTIAVIELKDAGTNLDKKQIGRARKESPVEQGFRYANKEDDCQWIVISNFKEIRLYCKLRSEDYYEAFEIEKLVDESEFRRFYHLLGCSSMLRSEGDESELQVILRGSSQRARDITAQFYKEYSKCRIDLLSDLASRNQEVPQTLLLEKAQKILDRVIFVCFCEDKSSGLLPNNLVQSLIQAAENSFDAREDELWQQCRRLFVAIDQGNPRRVPRINAYNGGLFARDDELDALSVGGAALRSVLELSRYDFESDLDVNVLGHVFEQSVADLEAIKSDLLGLPKPQKSAKRHREGIYYTPEYITKYIVEKTLGAYIDEFPDRLETVRVLDPACGSGAFLNQAHTLLRKTYATRRADIESAAIEEQSLAQSDARKRGGRKRTARVGGFFEQLDGTPSVRRDLRQDWAYANDAALLRHLFGVDLNEESAEITKLSLWLKTAKSDEPLRNLDESIRIGNSLVADKALAPGKAFDWRIEFPAAVEQGGFDVIIGNPPYVQLSRVSKVPESLRAYLMQRYGTSGGRLNTFAFFTLLSLSLLREDGLLGLIIPNTVLTQDGYKDLRRLILEAADLVEIVEYPDMSFEDATVENVTLILRKKAQPTGRDVVISEQTELEAVAKKTLDVQPYRADPKYVFAIRGDSVTARVDAFDDYFEIGDYFNVNQAIALKGDRAQSIHVDRKGDNFYKLLDGRDINRYKTAWSGNWLEYSVDRIHSGKRKDIFEAQEKLLFRRTGMSLVATYDADSFFALNTLIVITPKAIPQPPLTLKTLLAIFNSATLNHIYAHKYKSTKRVFSEIQARSVMSLRIPLRAVERDAELTKLVDEMLEKQKSLDLQLQNYAKFFSANFGVVQVAADSAFRRKDWSIVRDLMQSSITEKEEAFSYFAARSELLEQIECRCTDIDAKIDEIVADIYELSEAERRMVER